MSDNRRSETSYFVAEIFSKYLTLRKKEKKNKKIKKKEKKWWIKDKNTRWLNSRGEQGESS